GRGHLAGLGINPKLPCTAHAGPTHATGDDGGMTRHTAAGGEDARRSVHAVNVFRTRLYADQNDLAPLCFERLGLVGVEYDLARGGAWRGRRTAGNSVLVRRRIDRRMQQVVERGRIDPHHRLLAGDEALVGEVHRNLESGFRCPLAGARLQHPELAVLDSELDVLHVTVARLELREDLLQLGEDVRHQRFQRRTGIASLDARLLRNVLWRADAGHDILTLRVDEELAVDLFDTRRGIAREGNTGRGVVTHVAEYHRLHGDGRAPRVGNLVQAPVGDGASVLPGAEHCLDGAPELSLQVLRKWLANFALDSLLVAGDDLLPVLRGELSIAGQVVEVFMRFEDVLEHTNLDAQNHVAVHLDEATIAVVGEPRVA